MTNAMPTSSLPGGGGSVVTREEAAGAVAARPLGFNCPSCGVVLTIQDPRSYDGRPAPCPQCAVLVVPPRIFRAEDEDGPESIDLHPLPGLSGRPGERLKMPRAVHRPRRPLERAGVRGMAAGANGVAMSGQG